MFLKIKGSYFLMIIPHIAKIVPTKAASKLNGNLSLKYAQIKCAIIKDNNMNILATLLALINTNRIIRTQNIHVRNHIGEQFGRVSNVHNE